MSREYRDPVTGDRLSPSEHLSWIIQGVIRRWLFLGLITVATVVVWSTNEPVALNWWNLSASYLALFIESCVGIAMFSQTRRDAVIIREIRAAEKRDEALLTRTAATEEEQTALMQALRERFEELHRATTETNRETATHLTADTDTLKVNDKVMFKRLSDLTDLVSSLHSRLDGLARTGVPAAIDKTGGPK